MNGDIRLGVNIDHVATVRNARGGAHPDPSRAAALVEEAGGDGITIHLREDRRHIRDDDLEPIRDATDLPINLEMAATEEMRAIALGFKPHACCLVPEKREERTTEGGLDVAGQRAALAPFIAALKDAGIRSALFIEPDAVQVEAAHALGADCVELHTGTYCHAMDDDSGIRHELERLAAAARQAHSLGLEVHAGHGLDFDSVGPVAGLPQIREFNIGHFLIGEAIFSGLAMAITEMRARILAGRLMRTEEVDA